MDFLITAVVNQSLLGTVTELLAPHCKLTVKVYEPNIKRTWSLPPAPVKRTRIQRNPMYSYDQGLRLIIKGAKKGYSHSQMREFFIENGLSRKSYSPSKSRAIKKGYAKVTNWGEPAVLTEKGEKEFEKMEREHVHG